MEAIISMRKPALPGRRILTNGNWNGSGKEDRMGVTGRRWQAVIGCGVLLAAAGGGNAAGKSAMFKVTAVESSPQGQITMTSQVWVTPKQARADMTHPIAGQMKVLVNGGYFYQLDPKSKNGAKSPLPDELKNSKDLFDFLIAQLAFDAGPAIKSAKKIKTETISGYQCDVLTASKTVEGATRTITVWMPVKMSPRFPVKAIVKTAVNKPGVTANKSLNVTLSGIKLNQTIPASVFAIPSGYKITEGKVPPPPKPGGGK